MYSIRLTSVDDERQISKKYRIVMNNVLIKTRFLENILFKIPINVFIQNLFNKINIRALSQNNRLN